LKLRDVIDRKVAAWALYDWGNSAFATTVMAGFFPVFFKEYWSVGTTATESTLRLGAANSLASLIVVVLAPVLGALADRGGLKKRLLALFAFLGVTMTLGLFLVEQGAWQLALILYGLGVIGFSGGNIFYDALLLAVTTRDRYDRVSAFGFSLGYLGGAVLFACNVAMVLRYRVVKGEERGIRLWRFRQKYLRLPGRLVYGARALTCVIFGGGLSPGFREHWLQTFAEAALL